MSKLHTWEIINPSDDYTLQAVSFPVAAAAGLLLGGGQYGLEAIGHDLPGLPLFLFGGGIDAFIDEHHGGDLSKFIDANAEEIVACLDSVLLGSADRRKDYDAAVAAIDDPAKLAAFREAWLDKRSSLNNIGGRAMDLADGLRATA